MGSFNMFNHPNFRILPRKKKESDTKYALRMAAHLVSPPKEYGEHYTMECSDIARQIIALGKRLEDKK